MTVHKPGRRAVAAALLAGVLTGLRPAEAAEAEVFIDNFTFSPAELRVPRGATVTWTNRDDIPHTVTDKARPKEVRSAALDTGDRYARAFPVRGRFGYFCSLHPHMQGTVVVT